METASSVPARLPGLFLGAVRRGLDRRTRVATWYAVAGLPRALAGFLVVALLLTAGLALCVTPLGPWVVAAGLATARRLAAGHRRLAATLLGEPVPDRLPDRLPDRPVGRGSGRSPFTWRREVLSDPDAWRAAAWSAAHLPVAAATFAGVVLVWAYGALLLTYPASMAVQGVPTCAGPYALPATGTAVLAGAGLLLAAPWLVDGIVGADRALDRGLLRPSRRAIARRRAEQHRTSAMADAAATLRRLERDLHQGFRTRLTALSANLSLVGQTLPAGTGEAATLLAAARAQTAEALTDLRALSWAIRPPVLDRGLPAALRTLAARTGAAAQVEELDRRPPPAVETTAWHCAAELLDNAHRNGAAAVHLTLARRGDELHLAVRDDGRGGADPRPGGGLGHAGERVRACGGALVVDSPPGGPTTVSVRLPMG
jgi:signal transduction histidine kinase